jgi:glyoxylase-like metal-dependent hydrolase (beta-lactamase superfamily II)
MTDARSCLLVGLIGLLPRATGDSVALAGYQTADGKYPAGGSLSWLPHAATVPTEIVPDVYDVTVRADDNGRRYRAFLVDDDVPTLFDAGFADTTDALFDGVAATGLDPDRLVITHSDPDHIGGFDAVVDRYDVETYVPGQTTLETDHEPNHRYGDSKRIGAFEALHAPGHSRDHHAWVNESDGILIAGDAISGADLRGFPAGYLLPHAAVYTANLKQAELNLDRLLEYEFDAALVYHGSSVTEGGR